MSGPVDGEALGDLLAEAAGALLEAAEWARRAPGVETTLGTGAARAEAAELWRSVALRAGGLGLGLLGELAGAVSDALAETVRPCAATNDNAKGWRR